MRAVVYFICGCLLAACGAAADPSSKEIDGPAPESSAAAVLDYAACNSISSAAQTELTNVQQSVAQCEVDSDCREFTLAGVCAYRCYPFAGNDEYKAAIEAAFAGPISGSCDDFYHGECQRFPLGCPPITTPHVWGCAEGLCQANPE